MLNPQMRTLLAAASPVPLLAKVARDTGGSLRGTNLHTQLLTRDGQLLVMSLQVYKKRGDFADESRRAIAARLRKAGVPAVRRRERETILRRVEEAGYIFSIGVRSARELGAGALEFIAQLAIAADALIWDIEALRDGDGKKLLDIHGFVVGHGSVVSAAADEPLRHRLFQRRSRLIDPECCVLLRDLDHEGPIAPTNDIEQVLTEKQNPDRFGPRLHAILDRLRKVKPGGAGSRERITRLQYDVARASAIIDTRHAVSIARQFHGLVVSTTEVRDELGRLVLGADGNFDPDSLGILALLLVAPSSKRFLPTFTSSGADLDVDLLERVSDAGALGRRMQAHIDIDVAATARPRRTRLQAVVRNSPRMLRIGSKTPFTHQQIRKVLRLAREERSFVFDGWGFYDQRGRAYLVRDGSWDPAAVDPTAAAE